MSHIDPAEDDRIEASFDALKAATERALATDKPAKDAATGRIFDALDRLSGTTNILAHMSGWAAAALHLNPIPAGATPGLAAIDMTTGAKVNPDGKIPADILLAARLVVALLAEDTDSAIALWQTAAAEDIEEPVLLAVLHQMAGLIAPHMAKERTQK